MVKQDSVALLRQKCGEKSQARVAKEIGVSSTTVCQILSGTYGGDPSRVLQLVVETYGSLTVKCPVMGGELPLSECRIERNSTDRANHQRVLFFRTCPSCEHNPSATLRDHPKGGN